MNALKVLDGSSMKIGGRYLIMPVGRGGRLHDVWCNEITPGGHIRVKRCADRQMDWHSVLAVEVVEVLAEPPLCSGCLKPVALVSVGRGGAWCAPCLERVRAQVLEVHPEAQP